MRANLLDRAGCAELLSVPTRKVRAWIRSGVFVDPAGEDTGQPYWRAADVLAWAVAFDAAFAPHIEVTHWPRASQPADFTGAVRLKKAVALPFDPVPGPLYLIYAEPGFQIDIVRRVRRDVELLHHASAIVIVSGGFGVDPPTRQRPPTHSQTPRAPAASRSLRTSPARRGLGARPTAG